MEVVEMESSGMFDPVQVFSQTLHDLHRVAQAFAADESAITPREFLSAVQAAGERIQALGVMSMTALVADAMPKVPPEVRDEWQAELDLHNLMDTPEQQHDRMIRALKNVTSWNRNDH